MIRVWTLTVDHDLTARLRELLSADERARADRFCFERDSDEFVNTRAALRCILSRYLQTTPSRVELVAADNGKPALGTAHAGARLEFNVSHSGGRAVIALCTEQRVGVDIEAVRDDVGFDRLADDCFTVDERRALCALDATARNHAFFSCWARKEAFVKALGDGLSYPLRQCEVGLAGPTRVDDFEILDLPAPRGFCAALAVERTGDCAPPPVETSDTIRVRDVEKNFQVGPMEVKTTAIGLGQILRAVAENRSARRVPQP